MPQQYVNFIQRVHNMADKKSGAAVQKPAPFDPKKLSKEQQESVVEEYLGIHPFYFMYEGLNIKLNYSKFCADERSKEKADPKYIRKHFTFWKNLCVRYLPSLPAISFWLT